MYRIKIVRYPTYILFSGTQLAHISTPRDVARTVLLRQMTLSTKWNSHVPPSF